MAQTPLRECCVLGTEDGGLGLLIPIDEKIYLRMMLLQQLMNMAIPISALGLNPRDYRKFKSVQFRSQPVKNVLDGGVCCGVSRDCIRNCKRSWRLQWEALRI
jgi:hypothetical protein